MKNEKFYKRIQIPKKDQNGSVTFPSCLWSFWWLYIPVNFLVIFFIPFLSKNNEVISSQEYLRLCGIGAAIVIVLNIILSWFIDIRPYLNKRKGFYWRGNFIVIRKESSIGAQYLILKPGKNHRIKVRREFYRVVQERDRIFLERSYLGDILNINKISSGLLERIKRRSVSWPGN